MLLLPYPLLRCIGMLLALLAGARSALPRLVLLLLLVRSLRLPLHPRPLEQGRLGAVRTPDGDGSRGSRLVAEVEEHSLLMAAGGVVIVSISAHCGYPMPITPGLSSAAVRHGTDAMAEGAEEERALDTCDGGTAEH